MIKKSENSFGCNIFLGNIRDLKFVRVVSKDYMYI